MIGVLGYIGLASLIGSSVATTAASGAAATSARSGVSPRRFLSWTPLIIAAMVTVMLMIILVCILEVTTTQSSAIASTTGLSVLMVLWIWKWMNTEATPQQCRFAQMVCNTDYGCRHIRLCLRKPMRTPGSLEVYCLRGGSTGLHWSLVVRMTSSKVNLPYLTIEVNTDEHLEKLIPAMRQFSERPGDVEFVGTVTGVSIEKLCTMADAVKSGMGSYNVATRNCQVFCNRILEQLGLPTQTTTARKAAIVGGGVAAAAVLCNVM